MDTIEEELMRNAIVTDEAPKTMRTFENLRAVLKAAGSSMDDVMKCNVYQAGALPGGIAVEIECIARKSPK